MQTEPTTTTHPAASAEDRGDALYGATPLQAWRCFLTKYVVFSGRASRSEF
jgi:hypothetical protein